MAFGFPVGLSAAGDDPRGVVERVSAVSTAGYLAFHIGSSFLGIIGESVGLLLALIEVLIAVTIAGYFSHRYRMSVMSIHIVLGNKVFIGIISQLLKTN